MIRTNGSPLCGMAIGSEGLWRLAFDRMLTNRTTSRLGGSGPNGFSISNRERSLSSQKATSASNGSFRRNFARNFAREPGFRTIRVPAAPTFTTSWAPSSLASALGRKVLCPPTLMPRKKTIRAVRERMQGQLGGFDSPGFALTNESAEMTRLRDPDPACPGVALRPHCAENR